MGGWWVFFQFTGNSKGDELLCLNDETFFMFVTLDPLMNEIITALTSTFSVPRIN